MIELDPIDDGPPSESRSSDSAPTKPAFGERLRGWFRVDGPAWPWLVLTAALAGRLPFLTRGFAEVDEYQFGAALDDFDVRADRPHAPGFPVLIALGRAVRFVLHDSRLALASLSAVSGALAVLALRRLARRYLGECHAWLAALLFGLNPIVWITSLRALSEMPSLVATLASLVLLLDGADDASVFAGDTPASPATAWHARAALLWGAILGAVAVGIRSAACFVVLPGLALACLRLVRNRAWGGLAIAFSAFTAANLAWLVPLVRDTGGLAPLLAAMHGLSAAIYRDDHILLASPSWAAALAALHDVWIGPWGREWLGMAVVAVAGTGWIGLASRRFPRALELAWLFVPYAGMDLFDISTPRFRYHVFVVPLVSIAAAALPETLAPLGLATAARIGVAAMAVVAGLWAAPRAVLLSREEVPLRRAVQWLAPQVDHEGAVIHRDPDFRIPLRYLAPSWHTRALDATEGVTVAPHDLLLTASPDIVGRTLRSFTMERGLARMLTIDPPSVLVRETSILPGSGFFPLEHDAERSWRWTTQAAALSVKGGEHRPLDLLLVIAPLSHPELSRGPMLDTRACGGSPILTPLPSEGGELRVAISADCAARPVIPIEIATNHVFVPAEHDPGSTDRRRLSLQLLALDALPMTSARGIR